MSRAARIAEAVATSTIRTAARALGRRHLNVAAEGLEHVPARGPALIAARHMHHLYDGLALLSVVPRPIHILVALDWVEGRMLRVLMERATRMARWPVVLRADALAPGPDGRPRNGGSAFRLEEEPRYRLRAIREAIELLAAGEVLVVFPEGYPNIDPRYTPKRSPNEVLPFRAGFAVAAGAAEQRAGVEVPIVPAGLFYLPGVARWQATVRFGAPHFADRRVPREWLVRAVENSVARLSGLAPAPARTG